MEGVAWVVSISTVIALLRNNRLKILHSLGADVEDKCQIWNLPVEIDHVTLMKTDERYVRIDTKMLK